MERALKRLWPVDTGLGIDRAQEAVAAGIRVAEALLFAASEPVEDSVIAAALPTGAPVAVVMAEIEAHYAGRGVTLVRTAGRWSLRTAPDLAHLFVKAVGEPRRLSRAALETLSIVAYHQPVTRAEIEDIRGVAMSKGTLDVLLETGWVRMRGRRRTPGRPITYGTTDAFLSHFGLDAIGDLPGLDELKSAGLFDGRLPAGFQVPRPSDDPLLRPDEDALEPDILTAVAEERLAAAEHDELTEVGSDTDDMVQPLDPLVDDGRR